MRSWLARVTTALALLLGPAGAPVGAQEVLALRSQVGRLVDPIFRAGGAWGVLVVSLDRGDTLVAINPDVPLAPASNLKLLTSAAALLELGPEYRFRTYLMTDGEVVDGVVQGDVVLYGTGDPGISDRFSSRRLGVFHELADQLEAAGIHTIRGDLVADRSFLPGPLWPTGWDPEDLNDHFAAPVSALSFNENVVSLRIVGRAVGEAPVVLMDPGDPGMEIDNSARVVPGSGRSEIWISREHPARPVAIHGSMPAPGRDVWRQLTVPRPALFAGSTLRATLLERGIAVRGGLRTVSLPSQSIVPRISAPASGRRGARILATHVSPPLREYLEVINKESNNLFAELVFRTLGRVVEGSGTPEASARAVQSVLARIGVSDERMALFDGSGLSADNRLSPSLLVHLIASLEESPVWDEFWASLPEAGSPRGLRRMYRTAAAGNLRAKTGTIAGTSALSGMVRTVEGERLAFSLIVNGTGSTARAKAIENQIGAGLASFRRGSEDGAPSAVVADARDARPPTPDPSVVSDLPNPFRHQVTRGESLSLIAARYRVPLWSVTEANPALDPRRLPVGGWVVVPRRDALGGS